MDQFSKLFSIPLQILCRFLACKSITSVLKSNAYKRRHISFILKDDHIPSFTSKRILYLQEYMQPVEDLVLPCNTFRMFVIIERIRGIRFHIIDTNVILSFRLTTVKLV